MARRSKKPVSPKARRRRTVASLPKVPKEHQLEHRSRTVLKRALHPWLVTDWHPHDYGIDALVEIVEQDADGGGEATGKRFAVQLKATETGDDTFRVPTSKVYYWLESTERVLLVGCQLPSERLSWRWVDDALVEELTRRAPAWYTQETVTIDLGSRPLRADSLKGIAKEVREPRHRRRMLAAGTYVRLQESAVELAGRMVGLAKEGNVASVVTRLTELQESFRTATYILALTGPSRAGKSTLLNAMVGKIVAPVGRLPTTAVNTLVTAGVDERVEVEFEGGRRERSPIDAEFVAKYVTQECNPDNAERVRLVHLFVAHASLERGLAIADAPGLHDASPEIRAVTEAALKMAHAVLYVLDVAPAKHGGFAVTRHTVDDLRRLRAADRLIVVLNKADVLTDSEKDEVSAYVEREFRKYGLWEELAMPPQLVSAEEATAWRSRTDRAEYPLAALEEAVWGHLLARKATGLARLQRATIELRRGAADFETVLKARQSQGARSTDLRKTIDLLRAASADLRARCHQRADEDRAHVRSWVDQRRTDAQREIRAWLEGIPLNVSLPSTGALREHVAHQMASLVLSLWQELRGRFDQFTYAIREDVERVLRKGRADIVPLDGMQFVGPAMPDLVAPPTLDLPEAWLGLMSGGLLGLVIGGAWGLVLAGVGWILGELAGREARRKRDVERMCGQIESHFGQGLAVLLPQVDEKIDLFRRALIGEIDHRVDGLARDLELELPLLGEPLQIGQRERLEDLRVRLAKVLPEIDALASDLSDDRIGGV